MLRDLQNTSAQSPKLRTPVTGLRQRTPFVMALCVLYAIALPAGCKEGDTPAAVGAQAAASASPSPREERLQTVLRIRAEIDELTKKLEQDPSDSEAYYQRGKRRYNLSRIVSPLEQAELQSGAAEDFEAANEKAGVKGHIPALVTLSRMRLNMAQPNEAMATFERAQKTDPQHIRVRAAEAYYSGIMTREWPDAVRALTALTEDEQGRNDAMVWGVLGFSHLQMGHFTEAEKAYRRALELDPDDATTRMNLAQTLRNLGKMAEADAINGQQAGDSTNDLFAANNHAAMLIDQGKAQEASEILVNVVQHSPGFPMAWHNLGRAYAATGELDKAIDASKQAIELVPVFTDARINLLKFLARAGRFDEGEKYAYEGLLFQPKNAPLLWGVGWFFEYKGDLERSAMYSRKCVAADPSYYLGWQLLGAVYGDQKKFDECEEACLKALALRPDDSYSLNNLGTVYHDRGDVDKAYAMFTEAAEANPNQPSFYENIAKLGRKYGTMQRSVEQFTHLIETVDVPLMVWVIRASDLDALGRHEEALQDIDHLLSMVPPEYRYWALDNRGRSHLIGGDYAAAMRDLDEAVGLQPNAEYNFIWQWMAHRRVEGNAKAQAILTGALEKVDAESYTHKIIEFLLGKLSADELLAAAGDDNDHKCEACLYIGEKFEADGNAEEARKWYQRGVDTRAVENIEWQHAYIRLKQAGAKVGA